MARRPNLVAGCRIESSAAASLGFRRRGERTPWQCAGLACIIVLGAGHARAQSSSFVEQVAHREFLGQAHYSFDGLDRQRDAPPTERMQSPSDGVYGRFDGPISLAPFAGASVTRAGMLTELGLSAYYLHTLGVQVKYADGRLFPGSDTAPFSISSVAFAIRPLFLLRFSRDLEQGPSFLDLTIDSLTLKLGGFWAEPLGGGDSKRGLETEISAGIPLTATADGPWLTLAGGHRYPEVTHAGHAIDLAACARFEWSFSLGQ